MQVSVARYLRTPPNAAKREELKFSILRTAYAASAIGALLSFATSLNVPITVVTHRNKANPFRRSSILFRPHGPQMRDVGGDAGYRPRVRSAYYERVYVHSPEGHPIYGRFYVVCQGASGGFTRLMGPHCTKSAMPLGPIQSLETPVLWS